MLPPSADSTMTTSNAPPVGNFSCCVPSGRSRTSTHPRVVLSLRLAPAAPRNWEGCGLPLEEEPGGPAARRAVPWPARIPPAPLFGAAGAFPGEPLGPGAAPFPLSPCCSDAAFAVCMLPLDPTWFTGGISTTCPAWGAEGATATTATGAPTGACDSCAAPSATSPPSPCETNDQALGTASAGKTGASVELFDTTGPAATDGTGFGRAGTVGGRRFDLWQTRLRGPASWSKRILPGRRRHGGRRIQQCGQLTHPQILDGRLSRLDQEWAGTSPPQAAGLRPCALVAGRGAPLCSGAEAG